MDLIKAVANSIEKGCKPSIITGVLFVPKKYKTIKNVNDYLNKLSKGDKRCKPKFL